VGRDGLSHRKLAHRGSYLGRVWVSPATVFRVLLEHGRVLPHRPAREPAVQTPWPEWVQYRPNQVWGYDLTAFPAARTQALAIVDLVSRKWIDHLLCPEATSLQVQVLFTPALDAEGLLDAIVGRAERLADPAAPDPDQPVLLAVSDNGAQMTSGSTREFMALHAIATHFGRPGVPTDQAPVESFYGHLKHDWPYLARIADPGDLDRELAAVRASYNGVRLHAGIGYVTPDDEHAGRGAGIRHARRVASAAHIPSQPAKQPTLMTPGRHGVIPAAKADIEWETPHQRGRRLTATTGEATRQPTYHHPRKQ
jgi:putative transposase